MEDKKVSKPQTGNPLRYMWIAHFNDGKSLPEFDPFTFEKNNMIEVFDNEQLVKFGVYPIPPSLSKELNERGIEYTISNPFLPNYEVNLEDHKRLIFYRRNFIHAESFYKCSKCGEEFQACDKTDDKKKSPICPSCHAFDFYMCEKCGKVYNTLEETHPHYVCSCSGLLKLKKITSNQFSRERRDRETHIGYQETVKGVNKKNILKIDSNGNVELIYKK